MRAALLLLLALTGCTGEVLQRLETDIAALRERIQAREEVRIQMVSATAPPQTQTGQLASPTEPHVSVGLPPCPPAVVVPARASPPPTRAAARRPPRRGRR